MLPPPRGGGGRDGRKVSQRKNFLKSNTRINKVLSKSHSPWKQGCPEIPGNGPCSPPHLAQFRGEGFHLLPSCASSQLHLQALKETGRNGILVLPQLQSKQLSGGLPSLARRGPLPLSGDWGLPPSRSSAGAAARSSGECVGSGPAGRSRPPTRSSSPPSKPLCL